MIRFPTSAAFPGFENFDTLRNSPHGLTDARLLDIHCLTAVKRDEGIIGVAISMFPVISSSAAKAISLGLLCFYMTCPE